MPQLISFFILLAAAAPVNENLSQPACVHAKILPSSTIAAFSILDFKQWQSDWQKTGIANYFAEPAMRQFTDTVIEESVEASPLFSVLQSTTVKQLAGQTTLAIVESDDQAFVVLLIDAPDANAASDWLDARFLEMKQGGAKFTDAKIDSYDTQQILFPITNVSLTISLKNQRILISENFAILKEILEPSDKRLDRDARYAATVVKSMKEMKLPTFWWYVRPMLTLKYLKQPDSEGRAYELAKTQGFDALQAIGGVGTLNQKDKLLSSVGQVLARKPFERGMRILDLPNAEPITLPNWCQSSTSYAFINIRTPQFLTSFSTLFDELIGEGEEGVLEAVLEDLKSEPNGPRIDLQKELFDQLKSGACVANDISVDASQTLIGIKAADVQRVTAAINKMYDGDSRARRIPGIDYVAWKILPLEDNQSGIREPFIVAVRSGYLLLAPTIQTIQNAFASHAGGTQPMQNPIAVNGEPNKLSFAYQLNQQAWAQTRHEQLKSGQITGPLGQLLERAKLSQAIAQYDRTQLPDTRSVSKFFQSNLNVSGQSNASGWRIWIDSKKFK